MNIVTKKIITIFNNIEKEPLPENFMYTVEITVDPSVQVGGGQFFTLCAYPCDPSLNISNSSSLKDRGWPIYYAITTSSTKESFDKVIEESKKWDIPEVFLALITNYLDPVPHGCINICP